MWFRGMGAKISLALLPGFPAKRRQECRRGTQKCVLHGGRQRCFSVARSPMSAKISYRLRLKFTSTTVRTSTGAPLSSVGRYTHWLTAS